MLGSCKLLTTPPQGVLRTRWRDRKENAGFQLLKRNGGWGDDRMRIER